MQPTHKMSSFRKYRDCPSSWSILDLRNGELAPKEADAIGRHLAECAFCAAELELYIHYPPMEETVEPAEIPIPLYELAQALLTRRTTTTTSLEYLLNISEVPVERKVNRAANGPN